MKIAQNNISNFLKTFANNKLRSILFFGPEQNLIKSRIEYLLKKLVTSEFNLSKISWEQIKDEESLLVDEVNSFCFNGKPRVIVVDGVGSNISDQIKEIIKKCSDNFLLFNGYDLAAGSSWRKFFEEGDNFAAIGCYKDEKQASAIISHNLKKDGINLKPEMMSFLDSVLKHNYQIAMSEIEKLSHYLKTKQNITQEELEDFLADCNEFSIDSFCENIALGNVSEVIKMLAALSKISLPVITVLKSLTKYLWKIKLVLTHIQQGKTEKQAIDMLYPPIFYKSLPAFSASLKRWNEGRLKNAIDAIYDCEIQCKNNYLQTNLLFEQAILEILRLNITETLHNKQTLLAMKT